MAVYTAVSDEAAQALLERYDIGALVKLTGIEQGVENSNYFLETSQGRFILTIYEKRVDPADLPFFLGLLEHLTGRGFPSPRPVKTKAGALMSDFAGKPAAIVTFLAGKSHTKLSVSRCAALGEALARLHLAAQGFAIDRPNDLGMADWPGLYAASKARADEVAPGLGTMIEHELQRLQQAWPQDLPFGVIHADLFPDNVFFIGTKVSGFIDFYFGCQDFLSYDIAICLNAWCFEPDGQFNITKARALLRRYEDVRPLTSDEISALPVLAAGAAMRFLLTRLHDWLHPVEGALVQPKDPLEYVQKLRFHSSINHPEAYGLG